MRSVRTISGTSFAPAPHSASAPSRAGSLFAVLILCCGLALPTAPASAQATATAIAREDIAALAAAQQALLDARGLAAQLDEPAALARLLSAEHILRGLLHVPGVQAWLAEVWLQMGLVAAQRGETNLADTLLARALVLDPGRHVGAAEAAPPSVARSQSLARARDAAQRSRFRIEPTPATARCWIDGRALGTGSVEVEVVPGPHLVLLQADGYRPYAALIDALVGARSPLVITLAPSLEEAARQALAANPGQADAASLSHAQARPPRLDRDSSQARWWRRWPVWASAGVAIVAGAAAIGLAARDDRRSERRTLRIDPGPGAP